MTTVLLLLAALLPPNARCKDEPGETCVGCWTTAVSVACTVRILGHGCTFGNHVNFGGSVVCW